MTVCKCPFAEAVDSLIPDVRRSIDIFGKSRTVLISVAATDKIDVQEELSQ